jgi:YHS domain-containing protein
MAKFILWAVLILLLIRALSKLFRGVIEGAGYSRGQSPQHGVNLVRDPVCGVFVVPGQALTSGTGSETRHFCSERCRKEWAKKG